MRTSKPIATISYNSQEFLIDRLEELIRSRKISDYMFINHFAESDEKKSHIHLWIKPNTLIDSMKLQDFFREPDPKNPKKLLGCIDFHSSKVDDWILYNQHFEPYLASKFENREFHYTRDDFVYHDDETFEYNYNHAFKGSEWAKRNQILSMLRDAGTEPLDMIFNGSIPLNLATQLNAVEYMKRHRGKKVDRNGREGHD